MFGALLKSLEDPKRRLLGPTTRSLRIAGLLLPKNPIARYLRLFVHLNIIYFITTQYIEAYILRDDLGLLLTNLKVAMSSSLAFLKICSFIFFQETWYNIMDYVTKEDQFERDNQNDVRKEIIDKYTRYCRKGTYIYWIMIFNTLITLVVSNVTLHAEYEEGMKNGTAPFPHLVSSWTPFDKETPPGCWVLVAWHCFVVSAATLILGTYEPGVVVLIVFFGAKLDLMRERCKDLFGRGERLSEGEVQANLRQLHSMHVELNKHCRMFNSLLSPVMFLYIIFSTFLLCSSLFTLTSATQLFTILMQAQFVIYGALQLLIICLPSNTCLIKSQEVFQGPYESEWWKSTVTTRQKKDMLLLCGQLQQNYTFTAGPFINLNLATFVSILKGAYSYYTLLRE